MILPLTHERMTVQRLPWVTIGIIALNFIVFLFTWPVAVRDYERSGEILAEAEEYAMAHPSVLDECEGCPGNAEFEAILTRWEETHAEHIFSRYGYVPAHPTTVGLLGSLFLHAGWMHLLGNMYLLWLCGCSIEDLWGRPLYAAVYLVGGAGAALAHASFQPESLAHLVGASGAIAALMGVFLVRCYDTRIRFVYWFFLTIFGTFYAPAWIMLILWFGRELFYAFVFEDSASVAFWAHIGGFVFGTGIAVLVKLTGLEERYIAPAIERKTNLVGHHPKLASAFENIESGDYKLAIGNLKVAAREDRDNPDICRLLAQCYHSLGQPTDAARWLRQELTLHARRREQSLVAETYQELMATAPDTTLSSRELSAVASALMAAGLEDEAVPLYERLLESAEEPLLRLRAGLSLADFLHHEGRARRALEILERVAPLAEPHPEWRSQLEGKRKSIRASIPAALSEL